MEGGRGARAHRARGRDRQPGEGGCGFRRAESEYPARARRAHRLAVTRRLSRRPRVVLKLGGELLEQPSDLALVARGIVALASRAALVVVHGGGKEIDAALATAGIPK